MSLKSMLGGAAGVALLSTSLTIIAASPAEAFPCSVNRSKTSTSTSVWNNNCWRVRARIDRYYGGTVHTYTGDPDFEFSFRSNSTGTNAGNLSNKSVYGTSEIWDGWKSIP